MALTLHKLAEMIRTEWPDLQVKVEKDWTSTDRQVGRLIHPGKGRRGLRLLVTDTAQMTPTGPQTIYVHSSAETYRRNSEVLDWMADYRKQRAAAKRRRRR